MSVRLSRRRLLAAGATALIASACAAPRSASTPSPAGAVEITDALGTRRIPTEVRRVACLDGRGDLELAALCGYQVVAYYDRSTAGVPYPDSLAAVIAADAAKLDFEPSLEKLAALRPDLIILDSTYQADEIGETKLSAIAPVLVAARTKDGPVTNWRADFEYFAQTLGRTESAAAVFATYDAKLEALKTEHAEAISSTTVNLFHYYGGGEPGAFSAPDATLFGTTVQAVGGRFEPTQAKLDDWLEISDENLEQVRGDVVVRTTYELGPDAFAELDKSPLWRGLPSVEAGRVLDAAVLITNFGGPAIATACVDLVAEAYALTA